MDIIATEGLTKTYGRVKAVESLSLDVKAGEIYGFLGLNGAGKTTTIRMLLGMIRPSSGCAYLNGRRVDAGASDLWNSVGYLVEVPYAYPDLTVRENLALIRNLRGIADSGCVGRVIDRLKLTEYADRQARHLSLGNAQRLGLAKALMHDPQILILDEPANGLDPAGIVEIREALLDLSANSGVTIFISSHILSEISRIASRIGIIHGGRLLRELDGAALENSRIRRLLVDAGDRTALVRILTEAGFDMTAAADGGLQTSDRRAVDNPEDVVRLLTARKCFPKSLHTETEDLETYFLRIIGEKEGAAV